MTAVRAVLGRALRLEEDDAPAAARSRRDWIVDSGLFICAAVLAIASGVTSARQGSHGPLFVIDGIGGAGCWLAPWWRRRWRLGLGLASAPVRGVSPSAAAAGLITPYTVAAYRCWQLAVLVAAALGLPVPL